MTHQYQIILRKYSIIKSEFAFVVNPDLDSPGKSNTTVT